MIFFIPGQLLSLITFPGVIMHEIAHRFICDIFKIRVLKINYFIPFSTVAGGVLHEPTYNLRQHLCIAMAPLFINTILCMIFTLPLASSQQIIGYPSNEFGMSISQYGTLYYILWWIGISMGANAFPSNQDMQGVLDMHPESAIARISAIIMRGLNFLRNIWFSFIYAMLISHILPAYIFQQYL